MLQFIPPVQYYNIPFRSILSLSLFLDSRLLTTQRFLCISWLLLIPSHSSSFTLYLSLHPLFFSLLSSVFLCCRQLAAFFTHSTAQPLISNKPTFIVPVSQRPSIDSRLSTLLALFASSQSLVTGLILDWIFWTKHSYRESPINHPLTLTYTEPAKIELIRKNNCNADFSHDIWIFSFLVTHKSASTCGSIGGDAPLRCTFFLLLSSPRLVLSGGLAGCTLENLLLLHL